MPGLILPTSTDLSITPKAPALPNVLTTHCHKQLTECDNQIYPSASGNEIERIVCSKPEVSV